MTEVESQNNGDGCETATAAPPSISKPLRALQSASSPAPLELSLSLPDCFVVEKVVGEGAFSQVCLATHSKTSGKVAVKVLSRSKIKELGTQALFWSEVSNLRRVAAHPFITHLYDVVDRAESPTIELVMEFVGGGDMYDHIQSYYVTQNVRGLPERAARRFFQQMVSALSFLFERGIVHRDLKLENLLVDATKKECKIADFGLSKRIDVYNGRGGWMVTSCGSPHYAAPEVIVGEAYDGPPTDVWSCGVILYAMVTGFLPFVHADVKEQFQMIQEGNYSIPWRLRWGDSAHVMRRMLTVDPKLRITMQGIASERWYQHDLPAYMSVPIEKQQTALVDRVIFDQVLKLYKDDDAITDEALEHAIERGEGLDSNVGSEAVRSAYCAYQILIDVKKARERDSMSYSQSFSTEPGWFWW